MRFCFVVVLLGGVLASAPGHSAGRAPIRAIFDEGMFWAGTDGEVRRVLARVAGAGFNTYIPCVWHGQGATWPSQVAPVWDANPAIAAADRFGKFVELARVDGIAVLPCFTLLLRQREFLRTFASDSRPDGMFDVHNADFRRFAADIVMDVVERYDVAGVNLDYVRAGQVCYDADCRADYARARGRDLIADLTIHQVTTAAMDSIVTWQRDAMTELVSAIAKRMRAHNPDLLVTIDAAPWADSVVIEGQDSLAWLRAGLVDVVFSMNYEPSIDWRALTQLQASLTNAAGLAVMVSNYRGEPPGSIESRPAEELVRVVADAARFNPDGSCAVYLYSMLDDAQIEALRDHWAGALP